MVNITLSIPEELHEIVKQHSEIKWSEIARRAMQEYAATLQKMDKLLEKSKLTEKDVEELGLKIKQGIAESHRKYIKQHS